MTPTEELAIEVKGLVKRFGDVVAVDGIDLDIRRGECLGLLGPNGAGKTTTVEILEGLQDATSGEVKLLGLRWETHAHELRQRIGMTLHDPAFYAAALLDLALAHHHRVRSLKLPDDGPARAAAARRISALLLAGMQADCTAP